MEIVRYWGEHPVDRYGSSGVSAHPVPLGLPVGHATRLTVAPGGSVGRHPAPVDQLFLVIAGEGWVAGPDGVRVPVVAGDAVRWAAGEEHASGSDGGMVAVAFEG